MDAISLQMIRELGSLGLLAVLTLAVIRHLPAYIASTNTLAASLEALRVGMTSAVAGLKDAVGRSEQSAQRAADVATRTAGDLAARLRAVEKSTSLCPAPRDPATRERVDDEQPAARATRPSLPDHSPTDPGRPLAPAT